MSPILLSIATGIILWALLFAVGINSLPNVDKILSFFLKSIVVFFISLPIIVPLWWVSEFEYNLTPLLTIPAIFTQIFILLLMRVILLKILPVDIHIENILIIASQLEREKIKNILKISAYQYHIKRSLNTSVLSRHRLLKKVMFFCQKNKISKVIIGNLSTREDIVSLVDLCYQGIEIIDIDTFQEQHVGKISIHRFYNYNTLINRSFMPSRFNAFLKRGFDIIMASCLLLFLMPFMMIIAVLIKLNDGGAVFYSQKRTGYNGEIFNILKFRSMKENAEINGVQWASANDSRITKIGKFMRKTRIDELPQLINILKNDMSIVGPRPERPEFVAELSKNILYYNERHRIKPGLTGWAQINGGYAASIDDAKEKLEYDLYYLKYFNPSLDLLIVLKTISVVLFPNKVH
jgi:exopolysaccharide biosynthesis polyprenyl glycosylphosphotransferase